MAEVTISARQVTALRLVARHGRNAWAMAHRSTINSLVNRGLVRRFEITEEGQAVLDQVSGNARAEAAARDEAALAHAAARRDAMTDAERAADDAERAALKARVFGG